MGGYSCSLRSGAIRRMLARPPPLLTKITRPSSAASSCGSSALVSRAAPHRFTASVSAAALARAWETTAGLVPRRRC